ncbi:hypothetical protein B0T21DRAFT_408715 [Apiosordaria backusii]|uniref:Uncharacterized protein n=1 Tax=Apiosordaria backusii TaxID=314023 RepID=A0AA40EM24_9PEZI|nr:hypothetical protein B0T21DRAFT_408715 [Apiosordaria backusii]
MARHERQGEQQKKKVNVINHLISPDDVASKYNIIINTERPTEFCSWFETVEAKAVATQGFTTLNKLSSQTREKGKKNGN